MTAIANVIQGNEDRLFDRVYHALCGCGCSKTTISEFEKHKNDEIDELINVSCDFLSTAGFWA